MDTNKTDARRKNRSISELIITAGAVVLVAAAVLFPAQPTAAEDSGYAALLALFGEFREFQEPEKHQGVLPDYSPATMQTKLDELESYQGRLAEIDPREWSVPGQIDWMLVRAEMNGMEFNHRVVRPWARDPGFYLMTQEGAGPTGFSIRVDELPIPD